LQRSFRHGSPAQIPNIGDVKFQIAQNGEGHDDKRNTKAGDNAGSPAHWVATLGLPPFWADLQGHRAGRRRCYDVVGGAGAAIGLGILGGVIAGAAIASTTPPAYGYAPPPASPYYYPPQPYQGYYAPAPTYYDASQPYYGWSPYR
jgi:hypothetical protein